MASSFPTSLLFGTLMMIGLCCSVVSGSPNVNLVFQNCTYTQYGTATDPYQRSVDYVLNDLLTVTPNTPGFDYHDQSPFPSSPAFGHGTCTPSLSAADCVSCILNAFSIVKDCIGHTGGVVTLGDCTMEYQNHEI